MTARFTRRIPQGMPLLWFLLSCVPVEDPLDGERSDLGALDTQPLVGDWPAQATVVVSPPLLNQLVARAFVASGVQPPEIVVRPPIGGELHARPTLLPPTVELKPSVWCDWCLDAIVRGQGTLELAAGPLSGSLGWASVFETTVRVDGVPTATGAFQVSLVPIDPKTWRATVDVKGALSPYDRLLEVALEHELLDRIRSAEQLSRPIPIASIPADGPVRLRGLRAHATKGLAIDLGFSVATAGEVRAVPDPGSGFAVSLPAKTLLGLAHGMLVRSGEIEGVELEPTQLHVDNGRFELWLRVWKVSRKAGWREMVVRGTLGVDDSGLVSFIPETAAEVAKEGWKTPLEPLVKSAIRDALTKSAAVTVPGRFVKTSGQTAMILEVNRLDTRDDVVTVWGTIR